MNFSRCYIAILLLFFGYVGYGQNYGIQNVPVILTRADSIMASKIPGLNMPDEYKRRGGKDLPSSINNADLPFFRPAFSQQYFWNCGQCAGIGYNFCYEINQARNLPGDVPENQYSVNFTYNFMNAGLGHGVSYFNSFDILKSCGDPNLEDYGGLFNGADMRWMSGYQLYENAMKNRIREVYSIDVSTPEGLLTLKHWLNDHMDGSDHGGVASFYFFFGYPMSLPDDSPEAGQDIIILCGAPPPVGGHAMTIVGYNDSIRYDLNNDGRYTNNLDITGDGVVDMKDWEIGGVRYKNSSVSNDGYGLMLYSALAYRFGEGGIWNEEVHVINVKEDYVPMATMRVKIKHNSRDKIKLIAGIAQDTTRTVPEQTIDFPIFNFQGGDNFMQGFNDDEANKTLELSLDITPLLGFIDPGSSAKYFIQVVEKDESNFGEGNVLYYSVVDYRNNLSEAVSDQFPVEIIDNGLTTLSVISEIDFSKVNITTNELLAVDPGVNTTCQISAEGGPLPYSWRVIQPYSLSSVTCDFPQQLGGLLTFEEDPIEGVVVELPFEFPFYNDTISTITVFEDGIVMFEDKPFPYPFFSGEESLLKSNRSIGPFMAELSVYEGEDKGVWVRQESDHIEIVWQAYCKNFLMSSNVNFALKLFEDGTIETHFGEMVYPESKLWTSGISIGDNTNYTINSFFHHLDNLSFIAFKYMPPAVLPSKIEIDEHGELTMLISDEFTLYDLVVQVTDDNGISDRKHFQVPSGLTFDYEIVSGNNNLINPYDTVNVTCFITNTSTQVYHHVEMNFSSSNSHYSLLKSHADVGDLAPQQMQVIDNALVLVVNPDIPDQYLTVVSNVITSDEKQWGADVSLLASSADLRLSNILVSDHQNGILEADETAILELTLTNVGHADINDFEVEMVAQEAFFYAANPILTIAHLPVGDTITLSFNVRANQYFHSGTETEVRFLIKESDVLIANLAKSLLMGKIPVLVLDLDPNLISGPLLKELIDSLNINNAYTRHCLHNYDQYMSVFVCLGTLFGNVQLTTYQANTLNQFLVNGGCVYMEGRVTWLTDVQTSLHERFNFETEPGAYYFELNTIFGVPDQFSSDMEFGVDGSKPYINYYLLPTGLAFPLLQSSIHDSACVVANNSGNYKTVGSLIEFGNLIDLDTANTKMDYLLGILDFFELTGYMLSDRPIVATTKSELEMAIYPNPFSKQLTIRILSHTGRSADIRIFDITGRLVAKMDLPENGTDSVQITSWDGKDFLGKELPKGLYFIKLTSNRLSQVKKVIYH